MFEVPRTDFCFPKLRHADRSRAKHKKKGGNSFLVVCFSDWASSHGTRRVTESKTFQQGLAMIHRSTLPAIAGACLSIAAATQAAVIYGGASYDQTTSNGFADANQSITPGINVGNGLAVSNYNKRVNGMIVGRRATRWDSSGAAASELGNLGTAAGGITNTVANAVNPTGVAVGNANKYNNVGASVGTRAVRWDAGAAAATELGNIGSDGNGVTNSTAYAVNATGVAVGSATRYIAGSSRGSRAVRWAAGGFDATELGNIGVDAGGVTNNLAYAVNAGGVVVGYGTKYNGDTSLGSRAIRWAAGGTAATELGTLGTSPDGTTTCYAYALNAAGTSVGLGNKYNGATALGFRAVRWAAGGTAATELGSLDTDVNGSTTATAYSINAAGTAVGYSTKYANGNNFGGRAVRWAAGGTAATELGNLGTNANGVSDSIAYCINADGIAVGNANRYNAGTFVGGRGVAWGTDGVAIDLNTLLSPADAANWTLFSANSISDTNWITGTGAFDPDGPGPLGTYTRAYLIQLPEQSSLALLAAAGMLIRRRRVGPRGHAFSVSDPAESV
jgi:hypothetical protein